MPRVALHQKLSDVLAFAAGRLDARGLLPIDEARRVVASANEFDVGAHHDEGGLHWMDGDVLWGALLSLEDGHEFAREASRLRWKHPPRGAHENVDPFTRFGEGVLPWVAACVTPKGDLTSVPGNLSACLLEVGTDAAWSLVGRVVSVGGTRAGGDRLREDWVRRHTDQAVESAIARSRNHRWSRETLRLAADAGHVLATEQAVARGVRLRGARATEILRILDGAYALRIDGLCWPFFGIYDHSMCHHATRLVAARRPDTPAWCIVLQQITGDHPDWAAVSMHCYGPGAAQGWDEARNVALGVSITPAEAENDADATVTLRGPAGKCRLGPADLGDPTLAPAGRDPRELAAVSRVRTYLRRFRSRLWPDARAVARSVLGAGPVRIIADTDRFRHRDDVRPSRQATYRSLADAIERTDPSRFVPGTPNTWFDDPERRAQDG